MSLRRIKPVLLVFLLLGALLAQPLPAFAAANQIDGTIYRDQNNDGDQDAGEPGIENVVVSYGFGASQKTDLTDSGGHYALTSTTGTGRVTVHTGWYRSACNSLNCGTGTAGGNDFEVVNQIINLGGVNGAAGATLNAGLVPGWGGTYPIPASPTAAATDIAARLTYSSGCTGTDRLCTTSNTAKLYAWFLNQGTSAVSNPEFVVELPVGHSLNDASWANPQDVYNVTHPSTTGVTVLESYDAAKGYGRYRLDGTIPAGANSSVSFTVTPTSSAIGTATPYATTDPFDKQPQLRIVKIDQSGDPDSSFCETNGSDWRYGSCALAQLGIHDKTKTIDHTDGAGWNVNNGTPITRAFDLALQTQLASGQVSQVNAGDLVHYQLRVTNQGIGDAGTRNIKLIDYLPSGFTFSTGDNPGWASESGNPVAYVTAQLLPGQSFAIPLALRVKSTMNTTNNGTSSLKNQAEIVSFMKNFPSALGVFPTATDTDSTPDNSSTNDGTAANDEINGASGDEDDADFEDITIATGALVAPTVPGSVNATSTSTSTVNITWTASSDDVAVTGYKIYRGGSYLQTVSGTTLAYTDTGLTHNSAYSYTVSAIDGDSMESAQSASDSATTYQEFVTNKSVESNYNEWSNVWTPATTSLSRPSGVAHDGSYAIRVNSSSASSTSGGFVNFVTADRFLTSLTNGTTYTSSAWVKASISGMRICNRLTEYTGGTNQGNTETCQTYADTNWHQLTHSRTALASGNTMTISIYSTNIKSDRYFLADDFSAYKPN